MNGKPHARHDPKAPEQPDRPELNMGETGISVSLTSFMTAVAFFFIGLLLTGSAESQVRLRVPLTLLFLSAFGFLYSTLIYANASGEISRLDHRSFSRQMRLGNVVSEYFGVYCLVFAAPLTILGHSPDRILAVIVLAVTLGGFVAYHWCGFSILERYAGRGFLFWALVFILVGCLCSGFWMFFFEEMSGFYVSACVLVCLVVGLAARCTCEQEA